MAITSVRVEINGTQHNATYNSGTGKWSVTVAAPGVTSFNQPKKYYPVSVSATNTAGTTITINDGDAILGSALRLVVRENVKPTITVSSPADGAFFGDSGVSVVFSVRDEANGSGINPDSIVVKLDGVAVTPVSKTAVTNGYDCVYNSGALTDGAHTITISASDNDGNAATNVTRAFTIDTVPPNLTVTNPAADGFATAAAMTVQGTTNDLHSPGVTVKITLNGADTGAVTVGGNGSFSKALVLADGANTIVVTATDTAGRSTTVTRNITLDSSVPTVKSVTITPNPADTGATVIIEAVIE